MSNKYIKKPHIIIIAILMAIFFSVPNFAKTYDINGIKFTITTEIVKKDKGIGTSKDQSIIKSEVDLNEEEDVMPDEKVIINIKLKNENPYESCDISIKEKPGIGFKQETVGKHNKTIKTNLKPNEEKEYIYDYRYHKTFLNEQFNKFLMKEPKEVEYIENANINNVTNKNELINNSNNGIKLNDNNIKNKSNISFIIKVIFIFLIIIFICLLFYVFIRYMKYRNKDSDNGGFSKYNYYDGIEMIVILVSLSMILSVFYSKTNYANDYIPTIYQKGQNTTKTIKETIIFNERYYKFSYEVNIKYENKHEITDYITDTDGDGLVDALEYLYMTDKNNVDTDEDGLSDYFEVMILNYNPKSKWTFNDGRNDGYRDYDGDGLRNVKELELGTDITLYDTDGDSISDYDEINGFKSKDGTKTYITDPIKVDTDDDGLNDNVEIKLGLDPTNPMTDGITLDGERKIEQEYSLTNIPQNLTQGDIKIKSINALVKGDIINSIKFTEYHDANFDNNKNIVSNVFNLSNETGDNINIKFDVSNISNRVEKLLVVKFEDGNIIPIETDFTDNEISATLEKGLYGIVDCEYILSELSIFPKDYIE